MILHIVVINAMTQFRFLGRVQTDRKEPINSIEYYPKSICKYPRYREMQEEFSCVQHLMTLEKRILNVYLLHDLCFVINRTCTDLIHICKELKVTIASYIHYYHL